MTKKNIIGMAPHLSLTFDLDHTIRDTNLSKTTRERKGENTKTAMYAPHEHNRTMAGSRHTPQHT